MIENTDNSLMNKSLLGLSKALKLSGYIKQADVVEGLAKVKKLKTKPHPLVVKKLGMACSYPGTFESSIHSIINSKSYKGAILKTIKAGGCNCSRANFVGAYFAALRGFKNIPAQWIKKTKSAKKIIK